MTRSLCFHLREQRLIGCCESPTFILIVPGLSFGMCCSSRYFRAKCHADWAISNEIGRLGRQWRMRNRFSALSVQPQTASSRRMNILSMRLWTTELNMRHFRPSRPIVVRDYPVGATFGAKISTWTTHSEWNSRLRGKISVSVQVWNCYVQEICLSTLTGRSFAKVWSLST